MGAQHSFESSCQGTQAHCDRRGLHERRIDLEIKIKAALGKLSADPREVLAALEPAGFLSLPITGEHAARVVELPQIHRDPFDRLLIAQAQTEPMRLLTNDTILAAYGEAALVV